jgi:predicted secreted protein
MIQSVLNLMKVKILSFLTALTTFAFAGIISCTKSPCESGKIRNEIDCQCSEEFEHRSLAKKKIFWFGQKLTATNTTEISPTPKNAVQTVESKTWCVSDMCFVRTRGLESNPFNESDSGVYIPTKVGDKLYFSFKENPSTGYQIIVDNTTVNGVFSYEKSTYVQDKAPIGYVGVPGRVYFTITPTAVGSA